MQPDLPIAALPTSAVLQLVREVVRSEIAAAPPAPSLLDRAGLARALSCSPSTVDNLRRKGLPALWIGDSPRFELAPVLAWLRVHGES